MRIPIHLLIGFASGFIAVLIFHQGMVALLHLLNLPGLGGPAGWSMRPVGPFNVPAVLNASFWGGLYGILYAVLRPRLALPAWIAGLLLGLLAVAVLVLVVAPLKHFHPLGTWPASTWARVLLIHLSWGLGTAWLFARIPRPYA